MYLPKVTVDRVCCDVGVSPAAVELIDPACVPDAAAAQVASEILTEMRQQAFLSQLRIESLGRDLAIQLLRRHSNAASLIGAGLPARGSRDWRVRRAIDYLEARLAEDIGLDELAAAVALSPKHLADLFRAGTGEPPHRFLMRRRFERACEMLADPRLSITEIAHACGFASSQHMATVFQKRIGTTPSAYRRERLS